MKEKHFLNLSSEIPKLSKNEADQLKGGFKKSSHKTVCSNERRH